MYHVIFQTYVIDLYIYIYIFIGSPRTRREIVGYTECVSLIDEYSFLNKNNNKSSYHGKDQKNNTHQ